MAVAVGYAAFSDTLTISGTATANGEWEVKFSEATLSPDGHGSAPVVADNTITVNDLTLAYPGDGCTLTVKILNNGNLSATLKSLTVYNQDGTQPYSNDDISISVPDIDGEELAAGETCTVSIPIQWNSDSVNEEAQASFCIKFEYNQTETNPTELQPSHEAHA